MEPVRVEIALGAIALITLVNLRGLRESGRVFAIPTYMFVVGVLVTVAIGIVRLTGLFGMTPPAPPTPAEMANSTQEITTFQMQLSPTTYLFVFY